MISIKDKMILLIFGDELNGNQIFLKTGLNPATYSSIRSGRRNLGNLTVDTAIKLERLYNELAYKGEIKFNKSVIEEYKKRYDH